MSKFELMCKKPGLLVSVRSAAEARAALAGGADVIDVKEPNQGSLGAADDETISSVVRAVDRRALVSVAMGELFDLINLPNGDRTKSPADGVALFKIGLANCAKLDDWQSHWRHAAATAAASSGDETKPVAVVYADWRAAQSPPPQEVLNLAIEHHCPALLIDTWGKSSGSLFDHWTLDSLRSFLAEVRSHNIAVVLAGSLTGESVVAAARLIPDLVAVRTAACDGGRAGTISENRVRELKNAIVTTTRSVAVI